MPSPEGVDARKAALRILDAVLRRGQTMDNAAQAARTLAPADAALVARFIERAWSELGLADNTLASYRLDLEAWARWLARRGGSLEGATRADLQDYLGLRSRDAREGGSGHKARSKPNSRRRW